MANRYAMLSELGRGGMGIVWLAEDRMIGRRVAIKELHLPDGVPPEERSVFEERVLREARAAGRLNDPAVVTVYDVVQEAGSTYIVMEVIQAPTLSAVVRAQGPLPQHLVARLADQLLSALQAAHSAGVIHRDVKPSNIMVLQNGRAKLTDFGIAQSVDDPRLTTSGMLIGSPTYMAPERIRGEEADARSDLWALGAVLFYAVEGYAPFERSSTAATMHAILNDVPYLTRCQGPLASVIMGLLISNPQARLTPDQVQGLLGQVAAGPPSGPTAMPTVGGPTGLQPSRTVVSAKPARTPSQTRKILVTAGASVLALLLFLAGIMVHKAFTTPDGPDPAKGKTYTYGQNGDISTFGVSNGYCVDGRLEPGHQYDSSVGCDKAHAFEVFADLDPYTGVTGADKFGYPDVARLKTLAEDWCAQVFYSNRIGVDRNSLAYVTLIPSQRSWDTAGGSGNDRGDRSVYCVATNRDDSRQLTTSVLGKS